MSPTHVSADSLAKPSAAPSMSQGNTNVRSELEIHDGVSAPSYSSEQPKEISSTSIEPDHIGGPDGGRCAWLVVVGGFINFAIAFGTWRATSRRNVSY